MIVLLFTESQILFGGHDVEAAPALLSGSMTYTLKD